MSFWSMCHKKVHVGSKGKRRKGEMSYLASCPFRPKIKMTTLKKRDVFTPYSISKSDAVFMSQGYTFGLHPRATENLRKF